MKLLVSISLSAVMVLLLSAIPTAAYACGGNSDCCEKTTKTQSEKAESACCQGHSNPSENDKKDCGGDCSNSGCGCFCSFVHAGVTIPTDEVLLQFVFIFSKKAALYFRESTPESVYLSVWLLPKISG